MNRDEILALVLVIWLAGGVITFWYDRRKTARAARVSEEKVMEKANHGGLAELLFRAGLWFIFVPLGWLKT